MPSTDGAPPTASTSIRELDEARKRRAREDFELTMSKRLEKLHELCAQFTSIAGAARKR